MPARAPEMLGELLLELQSEEIPARMQQRAAEDLARLVLDGLKKAGLAVEGHETCVTPRRLALVVKGLPRSQPDLQDEKKGPRVGSPDPAVQGFRRSPGRAPPALWVKRDTPQGQPIGKAPGRE